MGNFVHLNVHTAYSLLSGSCRIKELVAQAKALGQEALAITDSGVLYGAVEFFDACKENGIKPIIGCQLGISDSRSSFQKIKPYRLILLCENAAGYRSLCRLIAGGSGVVDKARLSEHSEGLIAICCANGGEISELLASGREGDAIAAAEEYKRIYGDALYLELANHNTRSETALCDMLRGISQKTGIPTLPTNNVHYVEKSGSKVQRVLSCIGGNIKATDPDPNALPTEEYYLKSYDEMRMMFTEEELARTVEVAEKCGFEFEFGVTKLPLFTKEGVSDNAAYLSELCFKGAEKRYRTPSREISDEIRERLSHELSVIDKMGFTDYFLIVWDFVRFAKKSGIYVGPGRGSAAGSLCAYCLGITDTDPMRYNLLFERFLNPERVSMPDIDIDFCAERRDEVVEYVRRRYGEERVAQIIAFDTMKARGAIRDAGRVLGTPEDKIDRAANALPRAIDVSLKKELENGELKGMYSSDPEIGRLVDTALQIEGLPRNVTVHAPGVLITREPVYEYVPLGGGVAQYPAPQLERLGLLKMDLLSLRNLTVIRKTCDIIRETQPYFDIRKIDNNDKAVFEMLSRGGTGGVFQFESEGITSLLVRLQPQSIEDLAAANALYRPGPMDSIPAYLENRHKPPEQIVYKHPLLKPILEVTYGCIVYQEQVMEICRTVAGYSYGRADIVRRAMSKKKHDVMDKERRAFVYGSETNVGAVANGVPEKTANEIFDELVKFASYAFNKSHSAAYAEIAYQTAYLRCHFYLDYMCEVISGAIGDMAGYISELRANRVRVLLPDVNKSGYGFKAENGCVRFGLCGIKRLGEPFARAIIKERENGEFSSAADFAIRMAKHRNSPRIMEVLIMCGALDCFPQNRRTLYENAEALVNFGADESERIESGQLDLFGGSNGEFAFDIKDEFSAVKRLEAEREFLGSYISAHPADVYLDRAFDDCAFIEDALAMNNGAAVSLTAMCTNVRAFTDKKGSLMAFADFEDASGQAGAVLFADKLQAFGRPRVGTVYCVKGRLSIRDGKRSFQIDSFMDASALPQRPRRKLYVKLTSENDPRASEVTNTLLAYKGVSEVLVCFENTRRSRGVRGLRGVRVCPQLINALVRICGKENVVEQAANI